MKYFWALYCRLSAILARRKSLNIQIPLGFLFFSLLLLSITGNLYKFLVSYLGVGWSYVVDQAQSLAIALGMSWYFFSRYVNKDRIFLNVRNHAFEIAILTLTVFIVHGLLLFYYFYAEDVSTMLLMINNGVTAFPFHYLIAGYPFFTFIVSFLLFGTNAYLYNIFSLLFFLIAVIEVYWLIYLLSNNKMTAFIGGIFFATTSSFLDIFSWQATVQGMSFALGVALFSLLLLVYYFKYYYRIYLYLSLIFLLSAFQIGFVRTAGFVFIPIFFFLLIFKNFVFIIDAAIYVLVSMGFWLIYLQKIKGINIYQYILLLTRGGGVHYGGNYLAIISFYFSHLAIPANFAKMFFPFARKVIEKTTGSDLFIPQSFTELIGVIFIVFLVILTVCALFKYKNIKSRLVLFSIIMIISNIFYVPFFGNIPGSISAFDSFFIKSLPPSGPGSRYVFFPAVGLSMLFAFLFWTIREKHKVIKILFLIFMFTIVISNGIISFLAHKNIVDSVSNKDRYLIGNFFKLVPRDGKNKLVYSSNPNHNVIDNRIAGWRWLYGFYKTYELTYSNNINEVMSLIKTGEYTKNNFYAFYHNPETGTFTDITKATREELFSANSSKTKKQKTISFIKQNNLPEDSRNIFVAGNIDTRFIIPKTLHINVEIVKINPVSRYINALFANHFNNLSLADRSEIIDISARREEFRNGLSVSVSDIDKKDNRINTHALIDGIYTAEPDPRIDDAFYQASEAPMSSKPPVIISFNFPYPIILGRLILNTPRSLASSHSPSGLTVFASLNSEKYKKVASLDDEIETIWSPNNGRLRDITLKPVLADSLQVVISKTTGDAPVSFDEIIIDENYMRKYSPSQIYQYTEGVFWRVDDTNLYRKALGLKQSNTFTLSYACAEDDDWKNQNKRNELIPELWKTKTLFFSPLDPFINISTTIDCYGSILRKMVLIGPPYFSSINFENVYIQ